MALNSLFMSANHLARQGGRFEPQRANNCILVIDNLTAFGLSNEMGENILTLALESFPLPKQRNDPIEMPFLNQVVKVAGQGQTDEMEVVFRDFVDVNVSLVLQNWRLAVYDPVTGRVGRAANYKRQASVHLLAPDGASARTFRVEGLWPSMVDPGDADMGSVDVLKMNATFQFDRVYPIMSGWQGPVLRTLGALAGAFLPA